MFLSLSIGESRLKQNILQKRDYGLESNETRPYRTRLASVSAHALAIGRGVAQPGRALSSGGRGRRFESSLPDHFTLLLSSLAFAEGAAELIRQRLRDIGQQAARTRLDEGFHRHTRAQIQVSCGL